MVQPVNVAIGGYQFACYPLSQARFVHGAAVYVVLCVGEGGTWRVLDAGESGATGKRMDSHERKPDWEKHCLNKNIWVCIYPMPSNRFTPQDRRNLESSLRQRYRPPCGQR